MSWKHPLSQRCVWTLVVRALLAVEMQGPSKDWMHGDNLMWWPHVPQRHSQLGTHEAIAEAVLYASIPVVWQWLRMPYAPGTYESIWEGPLFCTWTSSSNSALNKHNPTRGVLSWQQSPVLHQEKRCSTQGRACSFPSWTGVPVRLGARAPGPCVRTPTLESELYLASRRGSWECGCSLPSRGQGQPLQLWWRE